MKRKKIEGIPWQCQGKKKIMAVAAKVFDIGGEEVLLVDFALDKPVVRVALTHKDFENYVPEDSPCEGLPKWGKTQYENFRLGNRFFLPSGEYRNWKMEVDEESAEKIHKFAYGEEDSYSTNWSSDIEQAERHILWDRREQEEYRRFERIKKKMATVPEPTEAFRKWALAFVEEHVMFMLPFHKKKSTRAVCSACGKEHEFQHGEIRPRQTVACPSCGAECTVKRADYEHYDPIPGYQFQKEVLLFQKIGTEFCERHFYAQSWVDISGESSSLTEIGRIFYPAGEYSPSWHGDADCGWRGKERIYYNKYNPWDDDTFWDDRNLSGIANIIIRSGPVYPRTINRRMFHGTRYQYCAMELVKNERGFTPIDYLKKFDKMPQMAEMMVKTGLRRMVLEVSPYDFNGAGKAWEQLGITKKQLNRLRHINGGRRALTWMRFEEGTGRIIDDDVLRYFERERIDPEDIDFISDRMSERRIMNYIVRQQRLRKIKLQDVLILWRDYLSMALRMKMDVQKELIFKPRDVKQAHDDAVRLCGGADVAKRAGEIVQKFPDVDAIMQEIKDKYEYADGRYAIVVPEKIEGIIYEGRTLGHCLDKSDIYFDRIQRRESFIVFLRKAEDIEKPYYTLEIEPDGTARQKRTTGDRQDKDFQEAVSFIRKWQRVVRKRLNESDKEMAAQSAKLREEEFRELRKNQTKVWHGALAGKLLADVLEADLLIANA